MSLHISYQESEILVQKPDKPLMQVILCIIFLLWEGGLNITGSYCQILVAKKKAFALIKERLNSTQKAYAIRCKTF